MPVVNEVFVGTVRGLTSEGSGVVEHESGQVFFVPGVWPGESAKLRVTGFKKRTGFAELVELLEASPERVEAPCTHHGFGSHQCGGCPWQFISIDAQLAEKEARVARSMNYLGVEGAVAPIWASPKSFGYRNRAQLKSDGRQIGYVSAKSNKIVAVSDCPILTDKNRQTLRELAASLPNNAFRAKKKQPWTTIDIDEDVCAGSVVVNQRRPFRQANDAQNLRMQEWLSVHLANADVLSPAMELFAGSGNFTQLMVEAGFPRIAAVEAVEEAVVALESLGLPAIKGEVGNLFNDNYVEGLARRNKDVGTLVLDPPRDGFKGMETLLAHLPSLSQILYISCNLATFSRDMQAVIDNGFTVREIQPLDQFPQTPHVEIMAWATRAV